MLNNDRIKNLFKNELDAYAHCDIPCGIYDPNDAIQAAKTVVRMTELMEGLDVSGGPSPSLANSMMRYVYAKEIHAKKAKDDVLVLWTDYFKPEHLERYPDLHEKVWNACKLGSFVKVNVDLDSKSGQVFYDSEKVSLTQIETAISNAGYKVNDKEAVKSAYDKLPRCCKVDG